VLAWLQTRDRGLNISPDSTFYIAAARGVAEGRGVVGIDGEPMSLYPPGLPWLLALPARLDVVVGGAQWLNLCCLAALVLGVGLWLSRLVRFPVAAGVATLLALSAPLLMVHTWLWSEPVYVLLSAVFLALLVRTALGGDRIRRVLAAAGLAAAAATLVRYAGLSLLPVAAGVLLLRPVPWRRRAGDAVVFGATFALPVAAWLARNVRVTGTMTGERAVNEAGPGPTAGLGIRTMADWFVPPELPVALRAVLVGVLVLGLLALVVAVARRRPAAPDPRTVVLAVAGGHVVSAFAVLVAMTSRTNVDPLGDRLLAPLVPALLVGVGVAVDLVLDGVGRRAGVAVGLAALVVLGAGSAGTVVARVAAGNQEGRGYNTGGWETPAVTDLLAPVPGGARVISNQHWGVYHVSGTPVAEGPRARYYRSTVRPPDDLARLDAELAEGRVYLVWIGDHDGYHRTPEQLAERYRLTEVARTSRGQTYLLSPLP
jgi:hypothetical protein